MFFQFNIFRRAKEKRLKKDAGRARWGQYFRNGNGNVSNTGIVNKDGNRTSKMEDIKDDLLIGFSSGNPNVPFYYVRLFQNICG